MPEGAKARALELKDIPDCSLSGLSMCSVLPQPWLQSIIHELCRLRAPDGRIETTEQG